MTLADKAPVTTAHGRRAVAPVLPSRGRLRPLGLDEVRIVGGFWADRQETNHRATLDHIEHWLERVGWIRNFDLAAESRLPDGRRGREFSDSEVYKYLEALAWDIGRSYDEALEHRFRRIVARVAAAQEPDGYLNTMFGRPGQAPRWSHLEWGHELYCLGHLFQAAVARARTRPDLDDQLVQVALRAADLVCDVFGPTGIQQKICGHPEIETALVELARATGRRRYLEQAALFIERRGHGRLGDVEWGRSYFQDDVPVRDATVLRGHAVRAGYLAAGAVDVAVETDDAELLTALETQWTRTVARRTYVTGGQGSRHQDEAFGEDWVLPPDRAYSETCAGVGSIMFSWRLQLALGGTRFADLIERTLYNVVATSPSHTGTAFYYTNTLHQRVPGEAAGGDDVSPRAASSLRAPWFEVSCCPPNVARTLASLAGLVATTDDDGLQIHQYAPCEIRTTLPDGKAVAVDVETSYPEDGVIRIRVVESAPAPWTLTLRVPAWADGSQVRVSTGDGTSTEARVAPGPLRLTRQYQKGDVVELSLAWKPRVSVGDSRIDAIRGCAVVELGPRVLCLESVDLESATSGAVSDVAEVALVSLDSVRLAGQVVTAGLSRLITDDSPWPYQATARTPHRLVQPYDTELEVPLIPYHDWAERGPSTMRVWLPLLPVGAVTTPSSAEPGAVTDRHATTPQERPR